MRWIGLGRPRLSIPRVPAPARVDATYRRVKGENAAPLHFSLAFRPRSFTLSLPGPARPVVWLTSNMTPALPLSPDQLDAMYEQFPQAFLTRSGRGSNVEDLVTDWGPLTAEHLRIAAEHIDSGAMLGSRNPDLKVIRHTHHRLAQLLAGGMKDGLAAKLSNYSVARVAILKQSPAFQELLAHYASIRDDSFAEFTDVAANLNMDMLSRLQEILDESPEKLQIGHILEAIKLLSDRTGHAPINKSVNLNVAADMGDRMNAARERLRKVGTG